MTGCPVRPGHVCAERERKFAKSSYLPERNPSPGSQPSANPHRPPGPVGMRPASSSFGSRSWNPATQKFGLLENPLGLQKSEQIRDVNTAGHKEKPIPDNVRQFMLKYYKDAQTFASKLGNSVTAAEVLAVAGNETQWGNTDPNSNNLARFGNFFGLHGTAPGVIGNHNAKKGGKNIATPVFPLDTGFTLSGQEFVKRVQNKNILTQKIGDDPYAFFKALNNSGLYAADNPNYAEMMLCTADKVCPNMRPGSRGSYTLAVLCIDELKQRGLLN